MPAWSPSFVQGDMSSRYRDGVTPNSRLKCLQKWL
jgi:hypothetical protein